MVRIVVNDSLDGILSVSSVCCGIFIERDSDSRYNAICVDGQMNVDIVENVEMPCDKYVPTGTNIIESEIRRLFSLLSMATRIVCAVNGNSSVCCKNVAFALESVQDVMSCDMIQNETITAPKMQKHVLRIEDTMKPLSVYHNMLSDKCKEKYLR